MRFDAVRKRLEIHELLAEDALQDLKVDLAQRGQVPSDDLGVGLPARHRAPPARRAASIFASWGR